MVRKGKRMEIPLTRENLLILAGLVLVAVVGLGVIMKANSVKVETQAVLEAQTQDVVDTTVTTQPMINEVKAKQVSAKPKASDAPAGTCGGSCGSSSCGAAGGGSCGCGG